MKILRVLMLIAMSGLIAGCQENLMETTRIADNRPSSMKLSVSVPTSTLVTRGVTNQESYVDDILIVLFSNQSTRKEIVEFELAGDMSINEAGMAEYVSEVQDVLSGSYRMYAFANLEKSPFSNFTHEYLSLMTETDLLNAISVQQDAALIYSLSGEDRLVMTTYDPEFEIIEDVVNEKTITLKRSSSHIEFAFKTDDGIKFSPTDYTVYNVPAGGRLFADSKLRYEDINENYFNSSRVNISSGERGFEFFMFENIKKAQNCATYNDRDKWDIAESNEDGEKKFVNAPDFSTYVVVKGSYLDNEYSGSVSYTIHLGNLQSSDKNNDFTVNRNEKHLYNVTVKGVNSIVTEATVKSEDDKYGGTSPGAEGEIYAHNNIFLLDAHYETVLIELDVNTFKSNNQTLKIYTPYMNKEHLLGDVITKDPKADVYWVKFIMPDPTRTSMKCYPKHGEGLKDIYDLVKEMRNIAAGKTSDLVYHDKKSGKAYVQAFVDEYFYAHTPDGTQANWQEFINTNIDRTISIMPPSQVSQDGNSIYNGKVLLSLAQRSIKTVYKSGLSTIDINGFGIETWDETGSLEFSDPAKDSDLNSDNGWNNTNILVGSNAGSCHLSKVGYFSNVSDNTVEAHVYVKAPVSDAIYSCLSRNRDLNGNGIIDSDEMKWYIPSVSQYWTIWIGEGALYDDTQLFNPADIYSMTEEKHNNQHHLYTSSKNKDRIYWAVEGSAYGDNSSSRSDKVSMKHKVRCVRNFKDIKAIPDDVTTCDGHTITVQKIDGALRSNYKTGEYRAGHTERSEENRLCAKFVVASKDLEYDDRDCVVRIPKVENLSSEWKGIAKYNYTISFSDVMANVTYEYATSVDDADWKPFVISSKVAKLEKLPPFIYIRMRSITDPSVYSSYVQLSAYGNSIKEHRYYTSGMIKHNKSICNSYFENTTDVYKWRVPNQRELMLMGKYSTELSLNTGQALASSTFFTHSDYKPYPFSFSDNIMTLGEGDYFKIRCVRDVQ